MDNFFLLIVLINISLPSDVVFSLSILLKNAFILFLALVVKHILKDYIKDANVNDIIIDFEEPIQVVLQGFINYDDIYKFKCDVAKTFNVTLSEKNIHSSFTFENLYYLIKERVYIPFYNASI